MTGNSILPRLSSWFTVGAYVSDSVVFSVWSL